MHPMVISLVDQTLVFALKFFQSGVSCTQDRVNTAACVFLLYYLTRALWFHNPLLP